MDFSNYARGCRDLSPTFSTSDDASSSFIDYADSNFCSVQKESHHSIVAEHQQRHTMTSPYSRDSTLFPPRRLEDSDMGPGFNHSQLASQVSSFLKIILELNVYNCATQHRRVYAAITYSTMFTSHTVTVESVRNP
ncbi:hypothetical protein KC19_VG212500 [Ceratodon purpureus]|uniref:Uncharacterized protein n=1 Tax=Ceratodon purpureus TaxID=3225 RepID=A0A8T0HSD6_CERPU|nr:hypothetical protein KC19_VG212500 [Ceratodon purpureus]